MSKQLKLGILFLIFIIFIIIGLFTYNENNSIKKIDVITYSDNYLKDLNNRLEAKGIKEKITKEDFIILEKIIDSGLINFSNNSYYNEKDNQSGIKDMYMKENLLFYPRVKSIREMCKQDKNYCNTILQQ